jgi:hypothetical protein
MLRRKLRPSKITTYLAHGFEVVPTGSFSVPLGNLPFIARQAEASPLA